MFGVLDQFTRAAAAVFRSHLADEPSRGGAAEAWDVDLEAASWRCQAPNLAPWICRDFFFHFIIFVDELIGLFYILKIGIIVVFHTCILYL